MKKVDAIHIVVTKADTLKDKRPEEFLNQYYSGAYAAIQNLCNTGDGVQRDHQPIGFSIGKLYIGDIFTYDDKASKSILELIKDSTYGDKKKGFLDRVKIWLNS